MQKTEKKDWLNDFLADEDEALVSSHPSFSKRMDLSTDETVELRFIGNRRETFLHVVTVGAALHQWAAVKDRLGRERAQGLMSRLRNMLKNSAPLFCLLYDDQNRNHFSATSGFSSPARPNDFTDYHSAGLRDAFARINPSLVDNVGAEKSINQSRNDSFQEWTRSNLTQYVAAHDFDAIRLKGEAVIYELKRVKEDVRNWCPYVNDEPNYAASMKICRDSKLAFRTVAYPDERSEFVAYHRIEATGKKKSRNDERTGGHITGRRLVCRPERITCPFPEEGEAADRYRSTRLQRKGRPNLGDCTPAEQPSR